MMDFDDIREYWDQRAAADSTVQSTTQDVYLREIEFSVLSDRIGLYSPSQVVDVGCGDGRTTSRLAHQFRNVQFVGLDYSSSMISNARENTGGVGNVSFYQGDVCLGLQGAYDLVYTTRCLINLPSWDLQKTALYNIHSSLKDGGIYIMIENFEEGQENFNNVRKRFGLSEIPIRIHNLFFKRTPLLEFLKDKFDVVEELNISSTYYLVSRVLYSKICKELEQEPDYFDVHHRLASLLPFSGEFGPVRLLVLRKKMGVL